MGEIAQGDDVANAIAGCMKRHDARLVDDDIVVISQKIVSKAEGRVRRLAAVEPTTQAVGLARETDKDARLVELMLQESVAVLRRKKNVIVVEDRHGFVMANAGIDRSNVEDADSVLLLPADPDSSARRIRAGLEAVFGVAIGVIIVDSFGRAWRNGVLGTAIGASGVVALIDARGRPDRFGRKLQITEIAAADALAGMATLLMGEADEGTPFAVVSGWKARADAEGLGALLRRREDDLFR
jgi:coenzyme F420-0:L-glutamate ligase / coenzyme F420-1:gamma-L-glutamate ligase